MIQYKFQSVPSPQLMSNPNIIDQLHVNLPVEIDALNAF